MKKEPATSREIKSNKVTLLVKTSSEGTGSRAFKLTVNPQCGVGEVREIPLRNSFGLLYICHLPIKGKTACSWLFAHHYRSDCLEGEEWIIYLEQYVFSRRKRGVLRTPLLCRIYKTAKSLHASSESSESRTSTCSLFCESPNTVYQYTMPQRICLAVFKGCSFSGHSICPWNIWIYVLLFKPIVAQEARISVLG